MTFLELCQRLRQEARISGSGPSSVIGQSGEMLLITQWINTALQDICLKYENWDFLRSDFSFPTISGNQDYSASGIGIGDFHTWRVRDEFSLRLYKASIGITDEKYLIPVTWDEMREIRLFSSSRTQTGIPIEYAVKPDQSLIFWPIPNDVFTVVGEYYKAPQKMVGDSDTPNFPSAYHMLIVWQALMYVGAYQSAPEKYAHGRNEYNRLMRNLTRQYLPPISLGEPLA